MIKFFGLISLEDWWMGLKLLILFILMILGIGTVSRAYSWLFEKCKNLLFKLKVFQKPKP